MGFPQPGRRNPSSYLRGRFLPRHPCLVPRESEPGASEAVRCYHAQSRANAYESRDTPLPAIIGQLLITILEVPGRKHTPTLTRKRIRDEVCWSDGAENPWRRSATWLVLRVSIQRALCSLLGPQGILHYKFFMCSLISSLCRQFSIHQSFPAHWLDIARTKLARRMAKLEAQGNASSSEVSAVIHSLCVRIEGDVSHNLRSLQTILDKRGFWTRNHHTKKMYKLPKRADPESMLLSLRHSRPTLHAILTEVYYGPPRVQVQLPQGQSRVTRYSTWVNKEPDRHLSTTDYYCLADMEIRLSEDTKSALEPDDGMDLDHAILKLRRHLRIYQSRACVAYKENAEQLSLILMTLMEVWMGIDSLAVRKYSLLVDYDPGFPPDLLHPLKVAKLSDMHRLKMIEEYLERRRRRSTYPLSDALGVPTKTCFAVRYFDQCEQMQNLRLDMEEANESAKAEKERELHDRSMEYEALIKQASNTACLFIEDEFDPFKRQHDDRRCRKHYLERVASRMRIEIHEDLLPADDIEAKGIVFEMLLPSGFAAWRESVWQLMTLARGDLIPDQKPKLLLHEY